MNESPLFKARQLELARRNRAPMVVGDIIPTEDIDQEGLKEAYKKYKKKQDPTAEVVEVAQEVEKEVFPPILENKAVQPSEVKEETKEDEEVL